jgi:hypothetical protein
VSTAAATQKERIRIEQHSFGGMLWFAGWLFTVGFLKLAFWTGAVALVIWPYLLGVKLAEWLAVGTAAVK